jgi:hypothetical protein
MAEVDAADRNPAEPLPVTAAYATWVAFNSLNATLIWGRFNGMLASNALLSGAVGIVVGQMPNLVGRGLVLGIGGVVGILFAWQWRAINRRGWEGLRFVQSQLKKYTFESGGNPMQVYDDWAGHRRGLRAGHLNEPFTRAAVIVFLIVYVMAIGIAMLLVLLNLSQGV